MFWLVIALCLLVVPGISQSMLNEQPKKKQKNYQEQEQGQWCYFCEKYLRGDRYFIKHVLMVHYACPWCDELECLAKGHSKRLTREEIRNRLIHIVECNRRQDKERKIYACKKCLILSDCAINNHICGNTLILLQSVDEVEQLFEHSNAQLQPDSVQSPLQQQIFDLSVFQKPKSEYFNPDIHTVHQENFLEAFVPIETETNVDVGIDEEEYEKNIQTSFFADSNQYDERKRVTFGRKRCLCGFEFKRSANCIDHIIEEHYSCPWCEGLTFIGKYAWKNLQKDDLELRLEHIAACARRIGTSLWRCLCCYEIFHIRRLNHKCGGLYLVNIGKPSNRAVKNVEENERLKTCPLCKKIYVKIQSCETHLLRGHGQCPFCKVFINKTGLILTNLSRESKEVVFDHLIACAPKHDRFIWTCQYCLGVSTMKTSAHLSSSCNEPLTLVGQKFYPKNHLLNNNNNNNNDEVDDNQAGINTLNTVQKCVPDVDGVKNENDNQNSVFEEDIMEILSQYFNDQEDSLGDFDEDVTKYFFDS